MTVAELAAVACARWAVEPRGIGVRLAFNEITQTNSLSIIVAVKLDGIYQTTHNYALEQRPLLGAARLE